VLPHCFHIRPQTFVFISQLLVELHLHIHVSPHRGDISLPEIKFASLSVVVQISLVQPFSQLVVMGVLSFQSFLKLLDALGQSGLVGVVGSPHLFTFATLILGLFLFPFTFIKASINLFRLSNRNILPMFLELSLFKFELLVVFESLGQLS
jgi:hypothetical protein